MTEQQVNAFINHKCLEISPKNKYYLHESPWVLIKRILYLINKEPPGTYKIMELFELVKKEFNIYICYGTFKSKMQLIFGIYIKYKAYVVKGQGKIAYYISLTPLGKEIAEKLSK